MSIKHTNNFTTTLSSGINNSVTDISLTTVTGAPTIGSGVSAYFTITDGTNYEVFTASTAPTGTTYSSVTRGAQGTTAQSWSAGATVMITVTADCLDRKLDAPSSITNYAPFCGPSATNGISQQATTGFSTSGLVFTTNGNAALPSFTSLNGLATLSVVGDGSIIYSNGTAWTTLSTSGSSTRYLSNQGTNNRPSWNQVNLTNGVTGILPVANGGTGVSNLGEIVTSTVSGVAITSATQTNITSISLTAGKWVIVGSFYFDPDSSATASTCISSIHTVSATLTIPQTIVYGAPLGNNVASPVPTKLVTPGSTTTYYLVGYVTYSGGTLTAGGTIEAIRIG